jgi:hypothetical protein
MDRGVVAGRRRAVDGGVWVGRGGGDAQALGIPLGAESRATFRGARFLRQFPDGGPEMILCCHEEIRWPWRTATPGHGPAYGYRRAQPGGPPARQHGHLQRVVRPTLVVLGGTGPWTRRCGALIDGCTPPWCRASRCGTT